MFYNEKNSEWFFIWNDNTEGKYWPFLAIYSKNTLFWENIFNIELNDFPAYKYSLWFTENKLFILEESGKVEILNFKK